MSGPRTPQLSIVIPMLNESRVLADSAALVAEYFDMSTTELILVDDGSTDSTPSIAAEIVNSLPHAQLVVLASNRGKGAAL